MLFFQCSLRINGTKLAGADPGFFLEGKAPLRNDVTGRQGKQILKANTRYEEGFISGGWGGVHPLHFHPRSTPNLQVCLATQRKSLGKFNLRQLATTCRSVWPGLKTELLGSLINYCCLYIFCINLSF